MRRTRPVIPPTTGHAVAIVIGSLLAVPLGACSDEGSIGAGAPELQVDRPLLDFGRVFVGQSPILTITVRNAGTAQLEFSARLSGETEGYAFAPGNANLSPSDSIQLQVLFRPRRPGTRQAELIISSNANSATVNLTAIGVEVPDCEDGNGCTSDGFDLATGRCVHIAQDVPCNDFNACTANDSCAEGFCLGEAVLCDDGDLCTDDACDPEAGCVHIPTGRCNDGNPCTRDICTPGGGCTHENLSDGVECDDGIVCTRQDACFNGRCVGVDVPEDSECDDGDPCTFFERCISGECRDPTVTPPGIGEVAFTATVGAVAPGAAENLIVDRDDTAYVGSQDGVTAVDQCGFLLWINDALPGARFSAAVAVPGLLTVPAGGILHDLDTRDGTVFRSLDVTDAVAIGTSSTATVTARIVDVAVRSSGALVASVLRTVTTTVGDTNEGFLVETNSLRTIATILARLGERHARRIAIDADESVIAVLRNGPVDTDVGLERVLRLGIQGVPSGTWASTDVQARRTEVALGEEGEVLWAAGLTLIDRQGIPQTLVAPPADPAQLQAGSPVTYRNRIYLVVQPPERADRYFLQAITATSTEPLFEIELPGPTIQTSPVVDSDGRVYLVTADGRLILVTAAGVQLLNVELPINATPVEGVSLTLNSRGFLLLAFDDRLLGIRALNRLSNSSWPRHRRDNLSTGHR